MKVQEFWCRWLQHPKPDQQLPQGFEFMDADLEFRRITTGDELEVHACVLHEGKLQVILKAKK